MEEYTLDGRLLTLLAQPLRIGGDPPRAARQSESTS